MHLVVLTYALGRDRDTLLSDRDTLLSDRDTLLSDPPPSLLSPGGRVMWRVRAYINAGLYGVSPLKRSDHSLGDISIEKIWQLRRGVLHSLCPANPPITIKVLFTMKSLQEDLHSFHPAISNPPPLLL